MLVRLGILSPRKWEGGSPCYLGACKRSFLHAHHRSFTGSFYLPTLSSAPGGALGLARREHWQEAGGGQRREIRYLLSARVLRATVSLGQRQQLLSGASPHSSLLSWVRY